MKASSITCRLGSIIALTAGALAPLPAEEIIAQRIFHEDFESVPFGIQHPLVEAAPGEGVDGSTALLVTYEGFERGSRRVVHSIPLGEQNPECTLVYNVKFDEGFDFARGGKLHGLGPASPVTGGKDVHPEGWSARVMFGENGEARTYLYNQNQKGKYGQGKVGQTFRFEPGRYHTVALHVKINNSEGADGFAHIYVDGKLVVAHDDVRFRGVDGDDTEISQLLFSTFHGGSSPDWAPKDEEGNYRTIYAWFDNISVYRGKFIPEE
jgi:hypothetical protein